ncbi:glycerol-3-phosphate phosphatase isoform X2 [Leptinotarsa decemlineata]
MNLLKQRGKIIPYATNNPLVNVVDLWKKLVREGFNAEIADVVNPILSVISYLKSINFNKKLYVVGAEKLKEELRKENFKLASDPPEVIEESISVAFQHISDDADIGAVIFSLDLSMTFIKLQKVLTYLKRKDCLFITTASDKEVPIGPMGPIIGTRHFIEMVSDFSGREVTFIGKPSAYFAQFINKKFDIVDPKRALFIGDQIDPDMKFGFTGGYQKLLVLIGISKIEDIKNWKHPEEYKPEYYIDSLEVLNNILKSTK